MPFFITCCSTLIAGAIIGGKDIRKILLTARDICIPMGVLGTLIALVQLLSELSLSPSIGKAILPMTYGIMLFPFFQAFSTRFPETPSIQTDKISTKIFLSILLLGFSCLTEMLLSSSLMVFIDIPSIFCIGIFLLAPVLIEHVQDDQLTGQKSKYLIACRSSVFSSILGTLLGGVWILSYLTDLVMMASGAALGLFTALYSGFILMGSIVGYRALSGKEVPHLLSYISTYILVVLTFVAFVFVVITQLY